MTAAAASGNIFPALFNEQPKENRQTVDDLLKPLLLGKPVFLRVKDPRLPKKQRVVDNEPLLMLFPTEMFNGGGKLIVAIEAHGCEILSIPKDLKLISFMRIGLNAVLSKTLATRLKLLYEGATHGQTTPGESA